MKHTKYFLAVLFFLAPFFHADAATYYVDSSCALSGNGSSQTCATANGGVGPFNSLAKVKAKAGGYTAGDFILLKRGQSFPVVTNGFIINWSGTVGNPITFADYGTGAKPIVNATGINRGFDLQQVRYVTLSNLEFRNATSANILMRSTTAPLQNIILDGVEIRNGITDGITFTTGASSNISNITIQNSIVDGNTRGFALATGSTGIFSNISFLDTTISNNKNEGLRITGAGFVDGLTIQDSFFMNNLWEGMSFANVKNLIIQNTVINQNGRDGIKMSPTIAISAPLFENMIANQNGRSGIALNSLITGAIISNSEFNQNILNGISLAGNTSADITVSHTKANQNGNDGFNITGNWSNVIFDHCTAESNAIGGTGTSGDGFSFHQNSNGIIRYSVSKNNRKTAVANVENSSVQMYYNIFSHDTNGTLGLVTLTGATTGAVSNHTLYNNIIYSNTLGVGYGLYMYGGGTGNLNVNAKNNIFYGFDTSINHVNGTLVEDNNIAYGFTTSGWSGVTPGAGSFVADPLFTNAPIGDFTIGITSPAINAGTGVGLTQDYIGNPILGNPDIGIYETL